MKEGKIDMAAIQRKLDFSFLFFLSFFILPDAENMSRAEWPVWLIYLFLNEPEDVFLKKREEINPDSGSNMLPTDIM